VAGKLGIGTVLPDSALTITGLRAAVPSIHSIQMGTETNGNSSIVLCSASVGNSGYIDFTYMGTWKGRIFYDHAAQVMLFVVNASERMRITASGVGIGTNSPTSMLHVVGDATITGNLVVSGSITESTPSAYSGQLDNTTSYSSQQLLRFSGGNPVNIGSCYNATTYLFTTPRAGYVKITAGLTGTGGSIYTVINGATGSYLMNAGGAAAFGCAILACAAGDTIGIKTNVALTITTAGFGTCVIEML